MTSRTIFLFWVGKEFKLISILRHLIDLHSTNGKGYKVVLLTHTNIDEYIENIPTYFYKLCPAHQADFVRVHVICDYGGIWLDSDTLVLDSLDSLFDILETKNGFFIKENNSTICNGIFGSKSKTPLMILWKTQMMIILNKKKEKISWTEIGNELLNNLIKTEKYLYDNYTIFDGLDNLYPINWDKCENEFLNKPYDNYKTIIRDYQPLIVLVNNVYRKIESSTESEILNGNLPLNYFINKSFENKGVSKTLYTEVVQKIQENKNTLEKKHIFGNIYKKKIWVEPGDNIPLSGPGSSLKNTKNCSEFLTNFIYTNKCLSVLDLGCGDLTWMSKTEFFNDNNIKYTGVDVVESLIHSHVKNYQEKVFLNLDITTYTCFDNVDIIVIRDVLFHLKNADIISIFNNIKNKFKYIMLTSCRNNKNTDHFDNKWHFTQKNINQEPFNISNNFEIKIEENVFNRNVYIYKHDNFYNN
jgi:hypothetical protein